jgi:hypothetical protein
MTPRALAPALALALAAPAARADPASGRVETDQGFVEILDRPVRVGERVDLPEGWYRVEEAGPEDGRVGSFAVVSSNTLSAQDDSEAQAEAEPDPSAPADAKPEAPSCRPERAAFVAELFKSHGVEVKDPVGFLQALEGDGFAPGLATLWLSLSTDPVRPLAWSSELRTRADALAHCARGG